MLLFAAAHVFATKGFARANVEAIASRAGMSRRTFYEHFDDLRAAMRDIHDRSATFLLAQVEAAMAEHEDPVRSIEAGLARFVDLSRLNADLSRVLFREVRAAGYERKRRELEDAFGRMLQRALEKAHARKQIRTRPPEMAVWAVIGAIESVVMRYLDDGKEDQLLAAVPILLRMTIAPFE